MYTEDAQMNSSNSALRSSTASCWCKLVRSIRESAKFNTTVDEFGLCILTGGTNSNMQWIKMIRPGMSLFCMWCFLFIMIHIFISTKSIQNFKETIRRSQILQHSILVKWSLQITSFIRWTMHSSVHNDLHLMSTIHEEPNSTTLSG